MNRIVRREEMAGGRMVLNEIEAPKIARTAQPGQFVMLRANELGERVPMTISDANPEIGTITIIFSVVGWSTALFRWETPIRMWLDSWAGLLRWRQRALQFALAGARALPFSILLPGSSKAEEAG